MWIDFQFFTIIKYFQNFLKCKDFCPNHFEVFSSLLIISLSPFELRLGKDDFHLPNAGIRGMSGLRAIRGQAQGFLHARQALDQLTYILSPVYLASSTIAISKFQQGPISFVIAFSLI